MIFYIDNFGGVAEWPNAPVLKTGDMQVSVGSNPTPSAKEPEKISARTSFWAKSGLPSFLI
jgi:hypothetical protein